MAHQKSLQSQPARNPRWVARWLVLFSALITGCLDLATKQLALKALSGREAPLPLWGDFLRLHLRLNSGAALSLLDTKTTVVTAFSALLLLGIVAVALQCTSYSWAVVLGMILGGGYGNLYDRFSRPPYRGSGHVVDFIDYNGWFVGNVADIFIVLGVALILVLMWREVPLRKNLASSASVAADSAAASASSPTATSLAPDSPATSPASPPASSSVSGENTAASPKESQ